MNITFKKNTRRNITIGTLLYRESEYSLEFDPLPVGGVTSVLIDYLNLEIDEEGNVLYVWGLAPKATWKDTEKIPPSYIQGGVQCHLDKIIPGVSKMFNNISPWQMFFNKRSEWLFTGEDINYKGFEYIEFAQNCVAILSDSGELKGLWLRPLIIP